jgi:hypothetical protein
MENGESAYFKKGKFHKGCDPKFQYNDAELAEVKNATADMDAFAVSKNGEVLRAAGGDCPVVTLYDRRRRIGAVLHVDAAGVHDEGHKPLIDGLLTHVPRLSRASVIHVLMDLTGSIHGADDRVEWFERIQEYLEKKGFTEIIPFSKGVGKTVELDTHAGELMVISDKDKTLLKHGYFDKE